MASEISQKGDTENLGIGLEQASSYDRVGEPVVHLADFDGTVYDGDVGQLAAEHDESHILGFEDIEDFLSKVEERRERREDVSRGSEKASIIVEEADSEYSDIERVLIDSQDPDRVKSGFKDAANELYRRGNMVEIVTAGVGAAAQHLLNGSWASVTGAEILECSDEGYDALYCGREEKPRRINQAFSELDAYAPVAVGDSPTDADFMEESVKAGGQAIAIEPGATEFASVDASEDKSYETAGVLEIIFDELYSAGSSQQAELRARDYLEDKDYQLADVEPAQNWNSMTLEALSVYEEVKQSYE